MKDCPCDDCSDAEVTRGFYGQPVPGNADTPFSLGRVRGWGESWFLVVVGRVTHDMSRTHAITENVVFDLISIQYHALQGAHLYDRYLEDARQAEHPDVEEFIKECRDADERRATRCHFLLKELTADTDAE